jgi:tetratricopeptide (TPR) repeat protein
VLAWAQTTTWRNEETLYRHALQETEGNWYAHNNLGAYLMADPQRSAEAVEQLEAALRIRPDYADANDNLGMCLARVNLCRAAIPHFEAALRARPDDFSAKNNLASCLIDGGQYTDAVALLAATLRAQPDLVEARYNLGRALSNIAGRDADAVAQYEAALRLRPDFAEAHRKLGQLLDRLGRAEEARSHMEAAQRIVNTQSAFRSTAP